MGETRSKFIYAVTALIAIAPISANAIPIAFDGSILGGTSVWTDFVLTGDDVSMDNILVASEVTSIVGLIGAYGPAGLGNVFFDTVTFLSLDLMTLVGTITVRGPCDGTGNTCSAGTLRTQTFGGGSATFTPRRFQSPNPAHSACWAPACSDSA